MKSHIPEYASSTAFDVIQSAFDQARPEMGLAPDRTDARAVVARAIFAAFQNGQKDLAQLNNAAWGPQPQDVAKRDLERRALQRFSLPPP